MYNLTTLLLILNNNFEEKKNYILVFSTMAPPTKNLRSQANQSLSNSSSVSRPSSSNPNFVARTDSLQLKSNENDYFDIDTSGLSTESKKIVSCIIKGLVGYFDGLMEKREEKFNNKVELLEKRIGHLEDKLDAQENYSRRDTLVLSGNIPEYTVGENCGRIIQSLISTKLEVDVGDVDISVAHRLGKKPSEGIDRRSIIFKLCRREVKANILKACRTKKPSFYINESLSPIRSSIMYVLRKARLDYPTKFGRCFSEDGNVKVMMPEHDGSTAFKKITVNTRGELEELLLVKANCRSSKYNVRWNL